MTPFEYLSVLVSIIIGLALTQLLSGAARLIQIRRRVRPHATTLLWMLVLFLIDTQIWWAAFIRRDIVEWNFFLFLLYLTMPIVAFLLSYLVLPELGDEDDVDLAANFADNRPWFFGLLAVLPAASLVEQWATMPGLGLDADLAFRLLFLALALVAACIRSTRWHFWLALSGLALICAYLGSLFLHLP